MNKVFFHKILFCMTDFLRGDRSIEKLRQLKKSQFWNREALMVWQLKKINIILKHAKKNSPFYKKRLKKITLPIEDLEFLQDIPILTKRDIVQNIDEIKCKNIPKVRYVSSNTGGSTGEPMHYFCDRISLGWKRAATLRNSEWAGLGIGEKNVHMMGSQYENEKRKKIVGRLKLWLLNGTDMSIAYINDKNCDLYYRQMLSWRPASIWGYPSGLYHFAQFVERQHPATDFSFIKAIITSSETLYTYQREIINKVFGEDKIFDHYGSSEFYIAAECRNHAGYHINADILNLEIVDSEGLHKERGRLGKVILTDFYNFVFPFIRYDIEDVGILSDVHSCTCGINLPLLEKIEGRIGDIVVLSDRILTVPNFNNIFRTLREVEQYQVVQKSMSNIVVNIVRNRGFNSNVEQYICNSLKSVLGDNNDFKLNYVDLIRIPKSGKRRYVISEVAKEKI